MTKWSLKSHEEKNENFLEIDVMHETALLFKGKAKNGSKSL